jgi:REP element-mobilizing transposase RayT
VKHEPFVAPGSRPAFFRVRSRGYLPHVEAEGAIYFVTFRTAGTLPKRVLEGLRHSKATPEQIDEQLDHDTDGCWLRDPRLASVVADALKFFDRQRYRLHAWCVMPNHVHVVFEIEPGWSPAIRNRSSLAAIISSWKTFTARHGNQLLGRAGEFWHREYYDHIIRGDADFIRCIEYTINNPVKAGLCGAWTEWPWTGLNDDFGLTAAAP